MIFFLKHHQCKSNTAKCCYQKLGSVKVTSVPDEALNISTEVSINPEEETYLHKWF